MLPNFFVVGAQKSGTTALHEYLADHPEIFLPKYKETKFFIDDERYAKGIRYYIESYFSGRKKERAIGEIDPDYMYFEHGIRRIKRHVDLTRTRFIFLLRNPIDRAFSHYLMTYRRGLEPLSFDQAIAQESYRVNQGYREKLHYSYIDRGFYCRQVSRFLDNVDRKQTLFLFSEDLKRDPLTCLRKIFEFLGVSADYIPRNSNEQFHMASVPISMNVLHRITREDTIEKRIGRLLIPSKNIRASLRRKAITLNETSKFRPRMREETRALLAERFEDENNELAALLDVDLSHWT